MESDKRYYGKRKGWKMKLFLDIVAYLIVGIPVIGVLGMIIIKAPLFVLSIIICSIIALIVVWAIKRLL